MMGDFYLKYVDWVQGSCIYIWSPHKILKRSSLRLSVKNNMVIKDHDLWSPSLIFKWYQIGSNCALELLFLEKTIMDLVLYVKKH